MPNVFATPIQLNFPKFDCFPVLFPEIPWLFFLLPFRKWEMCDNGLCGEDGIDTGNTPTSSPPQRRQKQSFGEFDWFFQDMNK